MIEHKQPFLFACMLAMVISFIIALLFGSTSIPADQVLLSLVGSSEVNQQTQMIVEQIRLPRALLAAIVGALLAICGAATQGLFRNPLADPSLIGVTAGASAGAAATIFFAGSIIALQGINGLLLVSIGAFIGGVIAVVLVYRLATSEHGTSVATMLLAGIAISAIAGGLSSLIEFFADNEMLRRISIWRMGGLDGADYSRVSIAASVAVIVISVLPRYSTALNALLLGESEARHIGIRVQKVKLLLISIVAFGVGISVALAGTISFVGLVVPHIMRLMLGPDHRYLLIASALGGAILVLLADTVARTIIAPIELPVGLVTALLGAPFFISLLRARHQFGMN